MVVIELWYPKKLFFDLPMQNTISIIYLRYVNEYALLSVLFLYYMKTDHAAYIIFQ